MDFKKIDFKDQKIQIGMIIVLVTIMVSYIWYENIISKEQAQVVTLKADYAEKQDKLNKIYAMRPHLQELRENVAMLNIKLDSLRSIFPDHKEVPKLVREVVQVAHKSGITTSKFTPLPPVVKEHYIENIDSVKVSGGYHELATFFNYLADFEMIINLSNVSIRVSPQIAGNIIEDRELGQSIRSVDASFNMTTFSSKK